MKTFLVAVVVAVLVVVVVEGRSAVQNNSHGNSTKPCLTPIFVMKDGKCTPATSELAAIVSTAAKDGPQPRHLLPGDNCPYCAPGVIYVYPDWDNCMGFKACLYGTAISYRCSWLLGGFFYNPVDRRCELFPSSSNVCIHRPYNYLMALQG